MTIDERLAATEGHTPGPWRSHSGRLYSTSEPLALAHSQGVNPETPQDKALRLAAPDFRAEVLRLRAELATQAEMTRQMREALEHQLDGLIMYRDRQGGFASKEDITKGCNAMRSALALTPTEAEERAKQNAEKAELLDALPAEWALLKSIDGSLCLYNDEGEDVSPANCELDNLLMHLQKLRAAKAQEGGAE